MEWAVLLWDRDEDPTSRPAHISEGQRHASSQEGGNERGGKLGKRAGIGSGGGHVVGDVGNRG